MDLMEYNDMNNEELWDREFNVISSEFGGMVTFQDDWPKLGGA